MRRTILAIAGSDPSGGAGIQADLKAIAAMGGYGAAVITALTAQNTRGVTAAEPVSPDLLRQQLDAVFSDLDVAVVKTGMLADGRTISVVADALERWRPPMVVCDPVMISKGGFPLLPGDAVVELRHRLLPLADLVTPNVHEARALTGLDLHDRHDAEQAGAAILAFGSGAVLVKGGHLEGDRALDVLVTAGDVRTFGGEEIATEHTHGTGCSYASAIAAALGRGLDLPDAIALAKGFIGRAIAAGGPVGGGIGPTDPLFFLRSPEEAAEWVRTLASAGAR